MLGIVIAYREVVIASTSRQTRSCVSPSSALFDWDEETEGNKNKKSTCFPLSITQNLYMWFGGEGK